MFASMLHRFTASGFTDRSNDGVLTPYAFCHGRSVGITMEPQCRDHPPRKGIPGELRCPASVEGANVAGRSQVRVSVHRSIPFLLAR